MRRISNALMGIKATDDNRIAIGFGEKNDLVEGVFERRKALQLAAIMLQTTAVAAHAAGWAPERKPAEPVSDSTTVRPLGIEVTQSADGKLVTLDLLFCERRLSITISDPKQLGEILLAASPTQGGKGS